MKAKVDGFLRANNIVCVSNKFKIRNELERFIVFFYVILAFIPIYVAL